MPLDVDNMANELPVFLHTQTAAQQATGLLADSAAWQPLTGKALAISDSHGGSLNPEQQWIQESLCGLPGPLGNWLVTALGVEIAKQHQQSLLVLSKEPSRCWISTVTPGEKA